MKKLRRRVELLSNIAIILGVILLGGIVVKRYAFVEAPMPASPPSAEAIKEGTRLAVADIDRGKSEKTLILALSTTCHFCAESTPFYQKLVGQKESRSDIGFVAVMPQPTDEARHYLSEHGIKIDEVRSASLNSIRVRGTPTLVLVDKTGAVVRSWVGKLPPEKETEVVETVFR